jgi:hypothetical protein
MLLGPSARRSARSFSGLRGWYEILQVHLAWGITHLDTAESVVEAEVVLHDPYCRSRPRG